MRTPPTASVTCALAGGLGRGGGRRPLVPRHRRRARPHPSPVRAAHRPVPRGQAPAGRHAGLASSRRWRPPGTRPCWPGRGRRRWGHPIRGVAAQSRLAIQLAAALALDGYVEAAKGAIQVLGGMGFTWEHDAHIHLRRATTLRQLLGGHRAAAGRGGPAGPGRTAPAPRPSSCPPRPRRSGPSWRRWWPPSPPSTTRSSSGGPWPTRAPGPALAVPVGPGRRCRRAAGHRPGLRRGRAPTPQSGRGRPGPCPPSWPTAPRSRPSGGWRRPCGARSSGASCSASPAPGPTWPR